MPIQAFRSYGISPIFFSPLLSFRGRFKILSREDSRFLEDTPDFLDAIEHAFPSGRIHYVAVPRGYRQSNYPRTKYTSVRFDYPGQGDRSHVLWTTTEGDINIDRMVKLYNIYDIQGKYLNYRHFTKTIFISCINSVFFLCTFCILVFIQNAE